MRGNGRHRCDVANNPVARDGIIGPCRWYLVEALRIENRRVVRRGRVAWPRITRAEFSRVLAAGCTNYVQQPGFNDDDRTWSVSRSDGRDHAHRRLRLLHPLLRYTDEGGSVTPSSDYRRIDAYALLAFAPSSGCRSELDSDRSTAYVSVSACLHPGDMKVHRQDVIPVRRSGTEYDNQLCV